MGGGLGAVCPYERQSVNPIHTCEVALLNLTTFGHTW